MPTKLIKRVLNFQFRTTDERSVFKSYRGDSETPIINMTELLILLSWFIS